MRITIQNQPVAVALDTLGGAIESILDRSTGEEHYWQYDASVWPRRTSVCFPVCGALPGDGYTHRGTPYAMPMHGFLRELDMRVVSLQPEKAVLGCRSDRNTRKRYPFDFDVEVRYELRGRCLSAEYHVENPGPKTLFFSIGSHYTYALPARQQDCQFRFSRPQHAGRLLIENGLMTGKSEDILCGADTLPMDCLFEAGAVIFDGNDLQTEFVAIESNGRPFTRVECEGFPYTVLWAPKGGDSPFVCIEAWAGMPDIPGSTGELSQKFAMQTLEPGETRTFRQRICL